MSTAPDIVRPRPVLAAIAVTVFACALVVWWALHLFLAMPAPAFAAVKPAERIVGPSPAQEAQRASREALTRWEWVDRDAGRVRMPIADAMEVLAR
jgi:hypothetical protein